MKTSYTLLKFGVLCSAALTLGVTTSPAALLTIDQVIFQTGSGQNPAGMTGTLDYTVTGASQVTLVITNTSLDSAFTDANAPASMLLTGFGIQLGRNITSGTVSVTAGSTPVNFDAGQSLTDISNQYNYANLSIDGYNDPGVLAVNNVVSSVNNGQATRFAGPPPVNIDGPDYGAISALESQFGASQPGVRASITFVLNLDGAAPSFATVNGGNVVLAFGSPTSGGGGVPDGGSTVVLLGLALAALGFVRRNR